ncbi:transporter [Paenibacillus silviterrae]|uniref:transporter n=1 Tax=Paenibacillus silviterrae TaxID=3242194 RepID=UPI00254305EA|nr:transporter [Paenibacillus chinjuensis]
MAFFPLPGTPTETLSPPPFYPPPFPSTPSYLVDCYFQYTYIWLWNGESFWFYPTSVEYGAVSGYRWNGLFWQYYGIDERLIRAVSCPPIPTLY